MIEIIKKLDNLEPDFQWMENKCYIYDEKVVRIPKLKKYNKQMKEEYRVSNFLTNKSLSFEVPRISIVEYKGKTCTVHNFIEGKTITKEEFKNMDNTTKKEIIKNIVDKQIELAKLDITEINNKEFSKKPPYILDLEKLKKAAEDYPELSEKMLKQIKIYEEYIKNSKHKRVLCHWDMHLYNILFSEENKVKAVIDFWAVSISDPIHNFTHFTLIWREEFKIAKEYYKEKTWLNIDFQVVQSIHMLLRIWHLTRFKWDKEKIEITLNKIKETLT